jgi:hypothetical protein
MSKNVRNKDLSALREALAKVESLLGASREPGSTSCAIFGPDRIGVEEFTVEQRRAIRLYVESWIEAPLSAAIDALEGARNWENEHYLDTIDRPWSRAHIRPS